MFETLKGIFGLGTKTIGLLPDGSPDQTFYPLVNSNYEVKELTRGDYLRFYTGRAYAAISKIADTVSDLSHALKRSKKDDTEIEHPYYELITSELLNEITSQLNITGTAYILMNKIGNIVDSLDLLRTDLMMIEEWSDGSLKGYRYTSSNGSGFYTKDEIIDFNLFSPFKTYPHKVKGMSPMSAVALQMEMDKASLQYNHKFFINGGSVKDILSTDKPIKEEVKDRIIAKWKNKFQGVNNSHKIAILDNGLKYSSLGQSQKEMDFVESRRFTRDEVFAIFKVPKSVLGITEDVNRANAEQSNITFYKTCISPFAKLIQERLNQTLFKGIGIFEFINVIPADNEQLNKDWNDGILTLNEVRRKKGEKQLKDGNRLKVKSEILSEPVEYETAEKKSVYGKDLERIIRKHMKGTAENNKQREETGEQKRQTKVKRTDNYEIKYIENINQIFDIQCRDILKEMTGAKSVKKFGWNVTRYLTIWQTFLSPVQKDVILNEGNQAYNAIGLSTMFKIGDESVNQWIGTTIRRFARSVDSTTKDIIQGVIEQGNRDGSSIEVIANNISKSFENFKRDRARTIARTEITRASTYAEEKAWMDSGVVDQKEWFTAHDERTCPQCGPMDGKIIDLGKNFFNKGGTVTGSDGKETLVEYENVKGAPLHVNCRCVLLPVIK